MRSIPYLTLFFCTYCRLRKSVLLFLHICASLHHIHYIISQFLTLADNIHIMYPHLVIIFLIIHIQHILILQLIAVVIYLILYIE